MTTPNPTQMDREAAIGLSEVIFDIIWPATEWPEGEHACRAVSEAAARAVTPAYRVQIEQSSRVGEGVREAVEDAFIAGWNACQNDEGFYPSKEKALAALAQPPLAPVGDVRESDRILARYIRDWVREGDEDRAAGAIARLRQSSTSAHVSAGYALVPVEPTEAMKRAAANARLKTDVWSAMISAAPALQAGEG